MASFKTKAPRNVVGVDCIHIQHPDAKFQLCGNIVFLVLESATCGAFRLAGARIVCARPEELVNSEVAELRGSVAPAAWPEQRLVLTLLNLSVIFICVTKVKARISA